MTTVRGYRGHGRFGARVALVLLLLVLTPNAHAAPQDSGGAIDTRRAIETRIYELEGLMSGDVPAERQAVTLRWLADLYVSVGRIDDAESAYERILVFYPYDVAATNAYAEFLLDTRHDPGRAEEVTRNALAWARAAPSPPPYVGETHALRARAFFEMGECERAIQSADQAVLFSEEDAAEAALRTRAGCLSKLGRDSEAKDGLLDLIGQTGASDPDDESALVALLSKQKKRVDAGEVQRTVAASIDESRKNRARALARENATLVELEGENRVRLEATLRRGDNPAAILFVPDFGGRRSTFTPYAQLFTLDGFTTMTLDPRGHGNSRCDSLPSYAGMPEHQRDRIADDVAVAYDYMVETLRVDAARIAIIAAGRACGIVERAIHEHNLAPIVVYLSPIFEVGDRDLRSAYSFRPSRPAFVLASDEDIYAVRSVRSFSAAFPSDHVRTKVYASAGHGVSLLREPAHFADVETWLGETLGTPSAAPSDARD